MKKQLFFMAMVSFMAAYGKPQTSTVRMSGKAKSSAVRYAPVSAADQVVEFLSMEKRHKDDWIENMKEVAVQKADLIEKHHDESIDLAIRHVNSTKSIASQADVQALMAQNLAEKVDLHEEQNAEWEKLAKDMYAKKMALCDAHKKELATWKAKLQ